MAYLKNTENTKTSILLDMVSFIISFTQFNLELEYSLFDPIKQSRTLSMFKKKLTYLLDKYNEG